MKNWVGDRFKQISSVASEQELLAHLIEIAREFGFDYCAYGIRLPVPVTRPPTLMFNNYPKVWQHRYKERAYLKVDPTVRHAMVSTTPVVWSNTLFEPTPDLWEEARCHGLEVGWAQAARDANGAVGMLTLARGAEPLREIELDATEARLVWLAQLAHHAMANLITPNLVPEMHVAMTTREKEVLLWTAEGKTSYEIGQILSVSERTVNFHINNVVNKLGASNKTQAAVKAGMLGMLV
jgi:LuxR family quorum-sensing system transcriptional regulator SolR